MDNTLKQLGVTTNYEKQYIRTIWLVIGWFITITIMIYFEADWLRYEHGHDILTAIYVPCILNCCFNVNLMDDLIITTILGYIELKFDQIHKIFQKIIRNNKFEIQHSYENIMLRQCRMSKTLSSKFLTWIVIHLHLELRKISREINTIFGMQMTLKMSLYFGCVTVVFNEMFHIVYIPNYVHQKIEFIFLILLWLVVNCSKLFFINYMCEKVSIKANTIENFINRILYSTCNTGDHENISQLLLHVTQKPLKFCGIGFFQFGFKYFYKFFTSLTTVLILLLQPFINK